eukprot:284685-Amphidinium_carterae.1
MLSGRSAVVIAAYDHDVTVEYVLAVCRRRLGLARDGSTMELWHGSEKVPARTEIQNWPGVQPPGKISEYQLLVKR